LLTSLYVKLLIMRGLANKSLMAFPVALLVAFPALAAVVPGKPGAPLPPATGPLLPAMEANPPEFEARVLAVHNRARAEVGAPPLAWDMRLADAARRWGMELARQGRFEHDNSNKAEPQGENLFMATARAYPVEMMIDVWEAEKTMLDGPKSWFKYFPDAGHYTQMVWRTTQRVGCSVVSNIQFEYLVCRYASPGNVIGEPVW